MRKSNWIAYIVAAIIAAFLLWLWFYLGFDHVDAPLDLVLTIIWCCLIIAAGLLIRHIEKKRQMKMRTCYVAGNKIFNPEKGVVNIEEGTDLIDAVYGIIKDLDYSFHAEQAKDDNGRKTNFVADYAIRSEKFKPQRDIWTGKVERSKKSKEAPDGKVQFVEFDDIEELRSAISKIDNGYRPSTASTGNPAA